MSQQRFNYYVTGSREPNIQTIVALANYFHVSTDYLLCSTTVQKQPGQLTQREKIAFVLQEARERRNFTQSEVSKILGISSDEISDYERGIQFINASLLMQFLWLYRLSPEDFFERCDFDLMVPAHGSDALPGAARGGVSSISAASADAIGAGIVPEKTDPLV